ASGVASEQLEGDYDNAKVSINVSGLSSVEVSAYLRINNDQVIRNNLGSTSPLTDILWNIRAAAAATTDQAMLDELRTGEVYLDINTQNYNTGEITGHFNKASGTLDFDPTRPDLIAPPLPGTLTAVDAERDIYPSWINQHLARRRPATTR
ncbi:MAG: hypothetical protein JWO08_4744, partial [Verrucomicrobiaceae bacterium]|nr:hypothetical protein [Verrucomicrobiaceae bacterium]